MKNKSQINLTALKQNRRGKSCANMSSSVKSFDIFGAEFTLKVGEHDKIKSIQGAICTGLMMALLIAYFCVQF